MARLQGRVLNADFIQVNKLSKLFKKAIANPFGVANEVRSKNIDIIFVHGFTSFLPAAALFAKYMCDVILVWQPHYHPFADHKHPFLARAFFYLFNYFTSKLADLIIVVSERERRFFLKFNARVSLIPWPSEKSSYKERKSAAARKFALFVGRNDENKNLNFILDNIEIIKKYVDKCVIVSNFSKQDSAFISDFFDIRSSITDDELERLYADATFTIVPSKYESYSLVCLESVLAGTPAIVSEGVQIAEDNSIRPFVCRLSEKPLEVCLLDAVRMNIDATTIVALRNQFSTGRYAERLIEEISDL